ncbi:MAG: DUF2334 domain-containing protein [Candidatus Omnitrophica bacterium]|nr:DUF2334 domain-containing protein [Candidatus Omnitrophota bacterium]
MRPTYLIRFDDICSTMNWTIWNQIEQTLDELKVKPILGIIPDNRDENLYLSPPNPKFWHCVRNWQRKGWTIGLHGYRHIFDTHEPGILALQQRSEFAGLSFDIQRDKIQSALAIFRINEVQPEIFIAPAHSLDETTVKILNEEGLHIISDGFYVYPCHDARGMLWVPQQLWRFHWFPLGVWTVCFHHNAWDETDLHHFISGVKKYQARISLLNEIKICYSQRARSWFDLMFSRCYLTMFRCRKFFCGFAGFCPDRIKSGCVNQDEGSEK